MLARDLMTREPAVVTPDEPIQHAAAVMRDRDVGFVPVVADRQSMRLRGVVTDRDIAIRGVAEHFAPGRRVGDVMTDGPIDAVGPDADARAVLALMARDRIRRVPVVDAGRLVGVIAQADLARRIGPSDPGAIEALVERVSEPSPRRGAPR